MFDLHYASVGKNADIVSVVLSGELDAVGCDYLLTCVEGQIRDGCHKLILDCEKLKFISSLGLGTLMRVHSRMRKKGGDVKLAAVHSTIADVFRLVALDKVLQIYPTVEQAIAKHDG